MRFRKGILILSCLLFSCCLVIGSGFSLFYFGGTEQGQNVSVSVAEEADFGTVRIYGKPDPTAYQLFLDASSVYLFRSDNPTVDASFRLQCDLSDSVSIPEGYTLALACDITLSDSERGVRFGTVGGSSERYVYSHSAVDYFAPSYVTTGQQQAAFFVLSGDKTAQSVTYRCILENDIRKQAGTETSVTTDSVQLIFVYQDYELQDGANTYRGSMAPGSQYSSSDGFAQVMEAARSAAENAEICIVFRLILQKEAI